MEIHFKIAGVLLMVLALLHFYFPKYFNWKQELGKISLINRQIMYVHSFFIAFAVFLVGLLAFTSAGELMQTALGKRISLGIGIFWGARLIIQFFGYSSKLWKGKAFETTVHIMLAVFWTCLTALFILPYFSR
ncbi:hypothetical protein [Niastella populi]|uniref:Uncharacterized protein n=1 Tax=Niastella populi TaxID=550983 RepID=A0A1V9F7Q4_9BACT|nr:hypothetical protein [Niastella populi]OQP54439.1 hypothetical protein A4R26_27575 [Niastella populi]